MYNVGESGSDLSDFCRFQSDDEFDNPMENSDSDRIPESETTKDEDAGNASSWSCI